MKKYFLILLSFSMTNLSAEEKHDHVVFDSFIVKFIDGTNLVNIGEIIRYAKNLFRLTKGTTVAEANTLCREYGLPHEHRF